jgi:hypothetical protein
MNLSIDIFHHFCPTPGETPRLKRIEDQLTQLIQAMSTQKEEILAAIAAEKQQFLDAVKGIVTNQGLSASDEADIISAIHEIVPDTAPAPGKHNLALTAASLGAESMVVSLSNNGIDDARLALLQGVYAAAKDAAAASGEAGETFESTVSLTVDGTPQVFVTKSEKSKAAADVAYLTAFLAEAQAQLAKFPA